MMKRNTKSAKPSYKGLVYEYMEKYIKAHDDKNHSVNWKSIPAGAFLCAYLPHLIANYSSEVRK